MLARMEAQRTSLQEQFNNRYLFISAGKALAGALLLALFYYGAFRASAAGATFFLLRILENVAPYRSTGGAISAILKFDSMLCWSSFSACWPVISG
ncbi:hypothetical protein IE978_24045 [Klebsiella pneumoniae]|uniref:Uncharacterized protein n=1 Tax=Klebsiella pneumoniae TaxID=573 RepID=A0A927E236_KLEPN|nr:hypothetical protein [Klebsiella pneumoniae]